MADQTDGVVVKPIGDCLMKMGIKDFVVDVNSNAVLQPTLTASQVTQLNALIEAEWPKMKIRGRRDKLLLQSDWMANSDVTMSDEWKTYRQALRDLPANSPSASVNLETGRLENVTWPSKPTG
tara:strand:- start:2346 stop:2714 length:369 start_codon:yes stop_codon:yes gene_type:complete